MPKRRKKTKQGDAGLLPSNFRQTTRWKIDFDYVDQLSPKEREWLSKFADGFYGGDFRGRRWTKAERSEVNMAIKAERDDSYAIASLVGNVVNDVVIDRPMQDEDQTATPEYLDDPTYKRARDRYRAQLQPFRKYQYPKDTPELRKAENWLKRVTPEPPVDPSDKDKQ